MHQRRVATLFAVALAALLMVGFARSAHRPITSVVASTPVAPDASLADGKAVESGPAKTDDALARTGTSRSLVIASGGLALIAFGLALIDLSAPAPAPARRPLPRRAPPRRRRSPVVSGIWISRSH